MSVNHRQDTVLSCILDCDYCMYGGRRLRVLLSLLFNTMIVHGHYPAELLKSTIVSIPKDKTASLSNSDNYRSISMFNSIHKLFDYVIIDICGDSLSTSDMQYGYKNNHSTTMCTVILKNLFTTTLMATVMFTVVY